MQALVMDCDKERKRHLSLRNKMTGEDVEVVGPDCRPFFHEWFGDEGIRAVRETRSRTPGQYFQMKLPRPITYALSLVRRTHAAELPTK